MSGISETNLIYEYLLKLANTKESLNFKDDAAVINLKSEQKLVVTADSLIKNQHFFASDSAKSIATKLLETNLSDLASMGSTPKYWTFAFILEKDNPLNKQWLDEFCSTLQDIQNKYNIFLIGGDTSQTNGELTLVVNAFGVIDKGKEPLSKFRAQSDDIICISNFIGDYFWGFKILEQQHYGKQSKYDFLNNITEEEKEYFIKHYHYPKAQVELGKILLNYANACADISDGVCLDLEKICKFSNKKAIINCNKIQFSQAVSNLMINSKFNKMEIIKDCLSGGGDYQLIFTISKEKLELLKKEIENCDFFIQEIGKIVDINKDKPSNYLEVLDFNNQEVTILHKGHERIL